MNGDAMRGVLETERPILVIDATHPYADKVSAEIAASCAAEGIDYIVVQRDASDTSGCTLFADENSLTAWLNQTEGNIFCATGIKEAPFFTGVADFKERVWFRLLPTLEGLKTCLDAGYPREHLILMWGPFSQALNQALFTETRASILVTKDSGPEGGFLEKKHAALERGMEIALLQRPPQQGGVSWEAAIGEIEKRLRGRP
jgi:precorrin-6x reductase